MIENKVILADDIFSNRLLLENVIEQLGYLPTVVDNGKKLIEELEKNDQYEIVFTDIEMPVMNGLEVVRHIRSLNSPMRNIAVIALTAHNPRDFAGKLNDAGFDDIMMKPYAPNKFEGIMKKYIKK